MIETEVLVSLIDLDANLAIQTRVALDADALERYQHALADEREEVERVVLFQDADGHYWVGDGHHRCRAQLVENEDIPIRAKVHEGTKLDALKYALKANSKHGLPRNINDLKKSLTLAEDQDLVDPTDKNAVADVLGCSVRHADRLTRPARSKAKRERNKKILSLKAEGKSTREIAEDQDVSTGTVKNVVKKRHVAQIDHPPSADNPPVEVYDSDKHVETLTNTPKPIESDPWETLSAALRAFLKSSPEQPAAEQLETTRSLVDEVRECLAAIPEAQTLVDEMLERLTSGQPYTAAEARDAFSALDLRMLATGKMTEAEAEHFLMYTFGD